MNIEEINYVRMVNNLLAFRTLGKRFDSIVKFFSPCLGIFTEEQNSCDCADTSTRNSGQTL